MKRDRKWRLYAYAPLLVCTVCRYGPAAVLWLCNNANNTDDRQTVSVSDSDTTPLPFG